MTTKTKQKRKIFYLTFIIFIVVLGLGLSLYFLYFKHQNKQIIKNELFISPVSSSIPNSQSWSLLLTGDIIPARSVNFQMTQKNDFMWPLTNIKDILKSADLTLINLESPLIKDCPLTNEGMVFCGDQRFANSLKQSGVDVVNLANNHSLNYGWEGLKETQLLLNNLGIETTGYTYNNSPLPSLSKREGIPPLNQRGGKEGLCQQNIFCSKITIKQVRETKIGFLGYTAVGQKIERDLVKQQIIQAKNQVDVLVISVHWGVEYTKTPVAESEDPKELGRWLIDAGADIVVGNHPHQIQPFEWYETSTHDSGNRSNENRKGLIFYALGNTVFDQEWSTETKKGILAKLKFNGKKLVTDEIEIIPIGIKDYGQAYLLVGEEKENILRTFNLINYN